MRVARLVFRGHLLPSFVTPFRHIHEFMQVVHPAEMETIGNLKGDQMEARMGKFEKEYEIARATIHQQVPPSPRSSFSTNRRTSSPCCNALPSMTLCTNPSSTA
jgi:hypothetical protein